MLAFADFETRSLADLSEVGSYRYARDPSTDVLVLSFAFDDEPITVWSPVWAWGAPDSHTLDQLLRLLDFVEFDKGTVVAWNAFFDRNIWNAVMVPKYDWPPLPIQQTICAMAQAEANNLPGALDKAGDTLGLGGKAQSGRSLIKLLSTGTRSDWDPAASRGPLGQFRAYGGRDTLLMRNIFACTRPLTVSEWAEYHAAEVINERGIAVDVAFAEAAAGYAVAEAADLNGQLAAVTGDDKLTITNHLRKAAWLYRELWPAPELQQLARRPPTKRSKAKGIDRLSADRNTREAIAEALATPDYADLFAPDHLDRIQQVLEIIEAGNGAAVNKFKAIVRTAYNDRVMGQYSFNGAGQTGRFSSRGIQTHNLIRKPLDAADRNRAIDAIDDIMAGMPAELLVRKYGLPMSRLLARLIRPTLLAPDGRMLVWGDWDQIEARVLPWLSGTRGGERKLDLFRAGEPVYELTAAGILAKAVEDVTGDERQAYGKVPELALGFGGSIGAFRAMGRNYGVRIMDDEEAYGIVLGWRRINAWAPAFWEELWRAAMAAWSAPMTWHAAGRVRYMFIPKLMLGTLVCQLPDGRWLTYPQLRRDPETVDEKTGEIRRARVSFLKGYGSGVARVALWYGTLAENITQAVAASLLRRALMRLQGCAVLHTHDEIGVECDAGVVEQMTRTLRVVMEDLPDWAAGLPVTASIDSGPYYTK